MVWKFVRTKLWHHGDQYPLLLELKEGCDPLTLGSEGQHPQMSKMEAMAGKSTLASLNNNNNNKDEYNYSKHLFSAY